MPHTKHTQRHSQLAQVEGAVAGRQRPLEHVATEQQALQARQVGQGVGGGQGALQRQERQRQAVFVRGGGGLGVDGRSNRVSVAGRVPSSARKDSVRLHWVGGGWV